MAKEWILNSATNRFQLNFKKNVGATSENIRKCNPKTLQEWQNYYFTNVKSKEHIVELGRKLYIKITEVIQAEVEEITEKDCIEYVLKLVINRTFDGYNNEIKTVYGQLEKELNCKIKPSSDEWDRIYNVDFFIEVKNKYIGIQIKPVNDNIQYPQIHKEKKIQINTHDNFQNKYGGKVFYIFSTTKNNKEKVIINMEVIQEIANEINRLNNI